MNLSRRFPATAAFVIALLLSASCGQPVAVGDLLSVQVQESVLVFPEKGSVRLPFVVDEPGYVFDLQEDVVLYPATGNSPHTSQCVLSRVERDTVAGRYVAVLTDTGVSRDYSVDVLLGIRSGDGSILFSEPFQCRGECYATRGVYVDTGLPVLYVNTEDGRAVTSKEDYLKAEMFLLGADGKPAASAAGCSIRGRGNTTWEWPKKPYLLKLDKKASLLGMPAHKRWVLLANFMDRTLMRNLVAMRVSSMTSLAWTPRCRSVELVLNGRPQGTYLLIEQVRVDENRVAVEEMSSATDSGLSLTGGYLLELDFHYDNEVQWMDPHGRCVQLSGGIPFGVKYPDPDDITSAQRNYIRQFVSEAATVLYGADFCNPATGYAKYLDVDSFIDYWIVFEVMGNHELGNPGSVYFHKDRGGKLVAGPCWDFDWGVLSYRVSPQARYALLNADAIWYARLFQDPDFRERLRRRYRELLPGLYTIPAFIDETEAQLAASAARNFRMWNPAQDGMINGDENLSFHDAVARLKTIYLERLNVVSAQL